MAVTLLIPLCGAEFAITRVGVPYALVSECAFPLFSYLAYALSTRPYAIVPPGPLKPKWKRLSTV